MAQSKDRCFVTPINSVISQPLIVAESFRVGSPNHALSKSLVVRLDASSRSYREEQRADNGYHTAHRKRNLELISRGVFEVGIHLIDERLNLASHLTLLQSYLYPRG